MSDNRGILRDAFFVEREGLEPPCTAYRARYCLGITYKIPQ